MKKFNITAPQSLSSFVKANSTKSKIEKNSVLQMGGDALASCIGITNSKDLVLG
jgi:hypothetical protein